jgi:hypothetical protein
MVSVMATAAVTLAVDFGTSHTVGVLRLGAGPASPLLFDASPMLASAVFAGQDGVLLTGADAERAASGYPAGLEANPKRRIEEGTVWLGEHEMPVVDLIAAVLGRVVAEATRVAGQAPSTVVLTHPATWSRARLGVLSAAARVAGLGDIRFVAEPVAAAVFFATVLGHHLPVDRCLVVYDLGAGTFDVSVLRRGADGFEVMASGGLPDLGGLDLDATVVEHARSLTAGASTAWGRLDWPQTPPDQRARRLLWRDARATKEQLSRHARAGLHIPLVETEVQLTRDEFDAAASPLLERTVELTVGTLRGAGVPREQVAGVFLVGGSSRVPLVASLLHRALGVAPTVIEQPELVVAEGALHVTPTVVTAPVVQPPAPAVLVAASSRSAGRPRRWWLSGIAAAAAAGLTAAAVVAVNLANGDHRTATPPISFSSRPSAAPSVGPSIGPALGAAVATSASPSITASDAPSSVDDITTAQLFIPRIPAQVRAMGCVADVTVTQPPVPLVTCGDLAKTSVIYYVYADAAAMAGDFEANLDASRPGGDCAKTPRLAVTTYAQGGHRGRLKCKAVSGSGFFSWTDETTLVYGQVPPSDLMSYKDLYKLWTAAIQVAPA